jgi:hypothetical protein
MVAWTTPEQPAIVRLELKTKNRQQNTTRPFGLGSYAIELKAIQTKRSLPAVRISLILILEAPDHTRHMLPNESRL